MGTIYGFPWSTKPRCKTLPVSRICIISLLSVTSLSLLRIKILTFFLSALSYSCLLPKHHFDTYCRMLQNDILRVEMSHEQMSRIGWRKLAHRQTYSSSDAYGECRDNEQAQACECRHGDTPTNWKLGVYSPAKLRLKSQIEIPCRFHSLYGSPIN